MRKQNKKQVLEFIQVLGKVHGLIDVLFQQNDMANICELLRKCQDSALQISSLIEQFEGQDPDADRLLEDYCESVYVLWDRVNNGAVLDGNKENDALRAYVSRIERYVTDNIREHMEVVFMPYKADMWDSLESVWQAADADKNCDAYVVPIPYFDRNDKGQLQKEYWEGDKFPGYVPVTHYGQYDLAERKPDMIFIHNPYDGTNVVTCVHPSFHSKNLKMYTDKLVYIPYFVLDEIDPEDDEAVEFMKHFCILPGVFNSDKTIVQSENMRQIYINVLTESFGEKTRGMWEEKILGLGSPKMDKVHSIREMALDIPEEWKKVIEKPDGTRKKIIFYNTGFSALVNHQEKWLEKIRQVFCTFKEKQQDVALLWRPHPLISATMQSMLPHLQQEYHDMVEQYCAEGWGIYDDTPELDRAIALCDAYYGDGSSLAQLCQEAGKPVMIQHIEE